MLQALIGFGRTAHIHRRRAFESDQSVVIEIVDRETTLRAFVASLSDVDSIGLVTIEPFEVLISRTAQELRS